MLDTGGKRRSMTREEMGNMVCSRTLSVSGLYLALVSEINDCLQGPNTQKNGNSILIFLLF
jgi:hypothetical protein